MTSRRMTTQAQLKSLFAENYCVSVKGTTSVEDVIAAAEDGDPTGVFGRGDFVISLQEEFGVEFSDEDNDRLEQLTVRQLSELIDRLVNEEAA